MAYIQITDFGGMAPIFRPRKLPDPMAVLAQDVRFEGEGLTPRMSSRAASSGTDQITLPVLSGQNWRTLMAHERRDGSVILLAWPEGHGLVHPVRSPVPGETLDRVYWSRAGTFPRVASQPGADTIAADSVGVIRRIGIPRMVNSVSPSSASPVTTAQTESPESLSFGQVTSLSQTNPVTVTASVTPQFKVGQTVKIEHQGATSSNGQPVNMSELNGRTFVVGSVTGNSFTLTGANGTTLSPATSPGNIKVTRVFTESDKVTRSYLVTLVSADGEEGPPSIPSTPAEFNMGAPVSVTVQGAFPNESTGASGMSATAWSQRTAINRIRVYRTSTGSETSDFFFLTEIFVSVLSGTAAIPSSGSVGFTDPNNDETQVLGEILPSKDWQAPPTGLQGLTAMPGGYLVGYVGNTLYASEPFQPHAWPDRYRRTTQHDIRGLAVYGDTLVIATTGKPYIAQGADPASLYLQQLDADAPCMLERTVVPAGIGVAWASRDGVLLVNASGVRNVTEQIFTRAQWEDLLGGQAATDWSFNNRRLLALSTDSAASPPKSWSIEFQPTGQFDFSYVGLAGRAPALNPKTGRLLYLPTVAGAWNTIDVIEGGATALSMTWRSKVFTMPQPVNFGAAQVFCDAYPVTLRLRYGSPATAGAQPPDSPGTQLSFTVAGSDPFRLPAGFMSREWQIEVVGAVNVAWVVVAESMDEIRGL